MKTQRSISKRQLQQYLNELIALAKTITSDVQSDIDIPGVEGQHAWLRLYVPEEFDDPVDDLVSQRALDIFIKTGYDIGVMVYEKSQWRQESAEADAEKKTHQHTPV